MLADFTILFNNIYFFKDNSIYGKTNIALTLLLAALKVMITT